MNISSLKEFIIKCESLDKRNNLPDFMKCLSIELIEGVDSGIWDDQTVASSLFAIGKIVGFKNSPDLFCFAARNVPKIRNVFVARQMLIMLENLFDENVLIDTKSAIELSKVLSLGDAPWSEDAELLLRVNKCIAQAL